MKLMIFFAVLALSVPCLAGQKATAAQDQSTVAQWEVQPDYVVIAVRVPFDFTGSEGAFQHHLDTLKQTYNLKKLEAIFLKHSENADLWPAELPRERLWKRNGLRRTLRLTPSWTSELTDNSSDRHYRGQLLVGLVTDNFDYAESIIEVMKQTKVDQKTEYPVASYYDVSQETFTKMLDRVRDWREAP